MMEELELEIFRKIQKEFTFEEAMGKLLRNCESIKDFDDVLEQGIVRYTTVATKYLDSEKLGSYQSYDPMKMDYAESEEGALGFIDKCFADCFFRLVMTPLIAECRVIDRLPGAVESINRVYAEVMKDVENIDADGQGRALSLFHLRMGANMPLEPKEFWPYFKNIIVEGKIKNIVEYCSSRSMYSRLFEAFLKANGIDDVNIIALDKSPGLHEMEQFHETLEANDNDGMYVLLESVITKDTLFVVFLNPFEMLIPHIAFKIFADKGGKHFLYAGEFEKHNQGFRESIQMDFDVKQTFEQCKTYSSDSRIWHWERRSVKQDPGQIFTSSYLPGPSEVELLGVRAHQQQHQQQEEEPVIC